jgi:hypothetical protein
MTVTDEGTVMTALFVGEGVLKLGSAYRVVRGTVVNAGFLV